MNALNCSKSIAQGLLVAATGALFCLSAQASSKISKSEYEQIKSSAKTNYDASLEKCKSLSGNAADVCKLQAKLDETKAISIAEARHKGTAKATYEARKEIADAQYKVNKELCDDKAGKIGRAHV